MYRFKPMKDHQPGEKPLKLSDNNLAFLLLYGKMDLVLLVRNTAMTLAIREKWGIWEL
jgi:hypothetical protein